LIKNGADLEARDCYGRSPSDITEQENMHHILEGKNSNLFNFI